MEKSEYPKLVKREGNEKNLNTESFDSLYEIIDIQEYYKKRLERLQKKSGGIEYLSPTGTG